MNKSTVKKRRRNGPKAIFFAIIIILIAAAYYLNSLLPIITGYAAKNLASGVFISDRSQEDMESHDLNFSFIAKTRNEIDFDNMKVTSRFLWGKSEAVYVDGFGVTILRDIEEDELQSIKFPEDLSPGYSKDTIQWPMGDIVPDIQEEDLYAGFRSVVDNAVIEGSYGGDAYAMLVLHKGVPVAEVYDARFNKDTRFLSWSMAKSVLNGLIGIKSLVDERLDIHRPIEFTEWEESKTVKGLTLNNLMQMQSGLQWNENYGNRSDITVMLHEASDFAKYVYSKEFDYEPGTHWLYSSGGANFLSYLFRKMFVSDADYYAFPYRELFYKIGITDAVIETDPSGTYIASSYMHMTARDYARFALLYQQDGVFCGERILPEGWVDYTVSEASASEGKYGSLFYLKREDNFAGAPKDMFTCVGHDGQRIFNLPSQELIVVVLGYSPDDSMDFSSLLEDILNSVPEHP